MLQAEHCSLRFGFEACFQNFLTRLPDPKAHPKVDRMHHEIEIMTRRLELEKRRLKRMDKELEAQGGLASGTWRFTVSYKWS